MPPISFARVRIPLNSKLVKCVPLLHGGGIIVCDIWACSCARMVHGGNRYLIAVLNCCVACFERLVKYLTETAFIQVRHIYT